MEIRWTEKVTGAEHRSSYRAWEGATIHEVATEHGTVIVYVDDGTAYTRKRPFAVLSIIAGGRRYSSGRHDLRKVPTDTGVARMAGRFARMVAADREATP